MWDEDEDFDSFDEEHEFEPSDDSLAEFSDFDEDSLENDGEEDLDREEDLFDDEDDKD